MTTLINFTKAALDTLPIPDSARAEYHDKKLSGLRIRVTSNNVKTFCVYKRVKGGAPMRTTLGRYPDMSIENARRQAAAILSEIAEGGNPAEVKRALRGELNFDELFQTYYERHAQVNKLSHKKDKQLYEQYVPSAMTKKKLSKITKDEIAQLHSKITREGHSTIANRVLSMISVVFNRGIEWSLATANPCEKIRRNKEVSRDRFLQSNELEAFFTALQDEQNLAIRDYIWLSLLTGARRANVLSMKWSELNLGEGIWRIPMTKNGTSQILPLSAEAIAILTERQSSNQNNSEFVFPGDGESGHLVEPRKGWERVLKAAEIADLRLHDLRRTMGSWQAKTGASLTIIGKSLNHKSQQATAIEVS